MKVSLKMIKQKEKEYHIIVMEINMKVNIKNGIKMEKGFIIIIIKIYMKGNLKVIKQRAKENTHIKMEIL